ncbi:uroporphyrinogen decarboxylase family protein [Alkalibacter saccharofermentans]|uniref:Uroporphyrinogen-III decarboxylase n=1 Tax=Alkalibacter saccharofermentans DSM 14828 TaxID=1120975 RepID=A0A1M4XLP6_9FIRM|nr:uroporphyrinogen decarboxylase family protein [Alkalibacter saccharofermentans]SHE94494.1 Uroporphyrinogen-III decarboxylase [Alkalibacter saccharofermentans DSM 14828]
MADMKKKSQEITQMFNDVYDMKMPKRVPISTWTDIAYAIEYCGYDVREAQWNMDIIEKVMDKTTEDFKSDVVPTVMIRFPQLYQILKAKNFVMGSDGFIQHPEVRSLEPEDYPEFNKDPYKFVNEKVLPRLYKGLDTTPEKRAMTFAKAFKTWADLMGQVGTFTAKAAEKHGVSPGGIGITLVEAPFDLVADQMRSFTGITIDIKRRGAMVAEACEAVLPMMLKGGALPNSNRYNRTFIPLHMGPFLNAKDFEKYYWPTFKKLCDGLAEKGVGMNIFVEQDWMRHMDYLEELPEGCLLWFEFGDPKLVKDRLGKKQIISGMYPVTLLRTGTKQQCIDKAKEVIDILAPGGNYIFNYDKDPLILADAKPENIIAVNEFVREYAVY